jgi:hypothetical protein
MSEEKKRRGQQDSWGSRYTEWGGKAHVVEIT